MECPKCRQVRWKLKNDIPRQGLVCKRCAMIGAGNKRRKRTIHRVVQPNGYVRIQTREDGKTTYIYEHRLVMEQAIGRSLLPYETVHHMDGNKANNKLENLLLISQANHNLTNTFCRNCKLKKEIRLLKQENKNLGVALQTKLTERASCPPVNMMERI